MYVGARTARSNEGGGPFSSTRLEGKKKATRRWLFPSQLRKTNYLVSPAGAAGVAVASAAGAAVASAAGAAVPSAGAVVVVSVVVVVVVSAGWFLEQVKPVVKESASKAVITIAFIVVSLRKFTNPPKWRTCVFC